MNASFLFKKGIKSLLRGVFLRYLGPRTSAILVDLPEMSVLVPASDLSWVRSLSKNGGSYAPLVDFLVTQISPSSEVLFVGTHIGTVLMPIAKKCRSVVGVEANPETFRLLELNLRLNDITNTQIFNKAAFDKKTELPFMAAGDNTGGSKVAFDGTRDLMFKFDGAKMIHVQGDRVDEMIGARRFDLIVIDIEGSEHKALSGMTEILSQSSRIVMEVLPLSIEKIAGISPEEFFNALPPRFDVAKPIHAPDLKNSYQRSEFQTMYADIRKHGLMHGVDILFEVSSVPAVPSSDTIAATPR